MGAMETLLARIGATQNPGHLVAQGVNKITTPGYPADDALRGYVAGAPAFQPTIGGMLKQTGTDLAAQSGGFLRSLMAGDYEAAMNSSLFPMGAMTVYHGSPHKFDAFDLSKIGTGEGAQAYGHGLYFAENPGVAKSYQGKLGGQLQDLRPEEIAKAAYDAIGPLSTGELLFRGRMFKDADEFATAYKNGRIFWGDFSPKVRTAVEDKFKGAFYHVDIPDDEIAKMLDWDKPLSEQPESVRKFFEPLVTQRRAVEASVGPKEWGELAAPRSYDPSGKELMSILGSSISGDKMTAGAVLSGGTGGKAASDALKAAGIPGIKYLDGGSRGAGEGSRNIVLFDDKLAKVLKRE